MQPIGLRLNIWPILSICGYVGYVCKACCGRLATLGSGAEGEPTPAQQAERRLTAALPSI